MTVQPRDISRRGLILASGRAMAGNVAVSPWQAGWLDIHHINTGRGNSTLVLGPDGTSILIDVGAAGGAPQFLNPARPNDSRKPGEWVARYVQRQLRATGGVGLDFVLLTHLHADHVGGLPDLASQVRIGKVIDRDFPNYDFPRRDEALVKDYREGTRGLHVERSHVGSATQISPRRPGTFQLRILSANGEVCTGVGEKTDKRFPPVSGLSETQMPTENMCSISVRISYGSFSYFTGGDLTCETGYGTAPWQDMESAVARVAGPVSVSTVNHHGYFDAAGPDFVRAMRARVWVLQSWHATHPAMSTLANLYSPVLYSGARDVFALGMKPETYMTCARFADMMKSREGHVLVRVGEGGKDFRVFILDDRNENNAVQASFGPYLCR